MDGFLSPEQQAIMSSYNQQMLEQMNEQQQYQQMMQQMMLNQNQMSQQAFQEQMYQQQMFGYNTGIPKLSRGQIIDNLSGYVYSQCGIYVSRVEKIDEIPQALRHSCVATGISYLQQLFYSYPSPSGMVTLPFFFCNKCGKLYYCPDYIV